jgi:hypothetical protein
VVQWQIFGRYLALQNRKKKKELGIEWIFRVDRCLFWWYGMEKKLIIGK